jgi:hypothetical protein
MRNRFFWIPALPLVLACLLPTRVAGQSVGIAPAQVVQTFKPGVPFEIALAAVNRGDKAVEMSVEITDFWYDEKNEKIFSTPGTSPRSAANWIQFVPEHFELPANGSQKMRAIVTPPADAKGGYYAVLFIQSKPLDTGNKTPDGKILLANMRVGCLVLLTAENTADYKIELSNVQVVPPSANQELSVSFDVADLGNTHVFPLGRLAVLDTNKKLVAKAESKPVRLLPGQKNTLKIDWSGKLPAGNYNGILTIAYGEDRIDTRQLPFTVSEQ